jgi:pimeloyl-ACP methyl ester carboxylesterase
VTRRSGGTRPWLLVLGGILAVTTACSSTPGPSSGGGDNPVISKPRSHASLAGFYHQHLAWADCGGGFQCAYLLVPLDYSRPTGRRIRIAVLRLPAADPAQRIGSLLVNPGGPGASGVDFVRYARQVFPASIRARFDIVGFDPRGVGHSTAVHCLTAAQLSQYIAADPVPSTPAQLHAYVGQNRFFAQRCEAKSGWLLPYVSTLNQARDMDVLRAVLGDRKLTYIGFSYGTYLGALYAQLFPRNIRAMVLDGALNPDTSSIQMDLIQAHGFEVDLHDFLNYCINQGNCPLGGSYSAANAGLARLTRRVTAHPEPGGVGRTMGPGEFFLGLAAALYDPQYGWPALMAALSAAENGDGAPMLVLTDSLTDRKPNGQYGNDIEANTAISCIDRPSPTSLSIYVRDAARAAAVAPHFGAAIVYGSLICAYWPVRPVQTPHLIRAAGAPPIVVIGTTRDPATPYVWAVQLAHQLASGHLVTYRGDGHTAYDRGNPCILSAVDAYLINLTVPPAGLVCG